MFSSIFEFIQRLGNTFIEVYEWPETTVRMKRLKDEPDFDTLTQRKADLSFNGVGLAHAVVRADYLDRRSLVTPGIAFLLQAHGIVDFGSRPVALKNGTNAAMNDFSLTSLAGRVGQGLTILYAHSLGMKFTAHLHSHLASLNGGAAVSGPVADFLFSDGVQSIVFESKASFALQDNDPSHIKGRLKSALERQVDPSLMRITPTPSNGYVVYSCLRESAWRPSAIFVVDPPSDSQGAADIPCSPEQIWRENYGAWLRAMGLHEAGQRLIGAPHSSGEPREEAFALRDIGGRRYAFRLNPNLPSLDWDLPCISLGIDLEVLEVLSKVLQSPTTEDVKLDLSTFTTFSEQSDEVSVFPDGSIFGRLRTWPDDVVEMLM